MCCREAGRLAVVGKEMATVAAPTVGGAATAGVEVAPGVEVRAPG